MSRRTIPPIAPTDLRDHADPDRIDRIWQRLENDLPEAGARPVGRPRAIWALAAAAALGAFAGGVVVGRAIHGDREAAPVTTAPSPDRISVDILAAGSSRLTLPIPGGGQITLEPGATVEVERPSSGSVLLRLVQGEAAVDVGGAPSDKAYSIVAGDALLATQAGSVVRVSRGNDHLNVNVQAGSARLTSPDGVQQQLRDGERADAIPLHRQTASLSNPNAIHAPRAPVAVTSAEVGPAEAPAAAVAVAPVDWFALANQNKYKEAFEQLKLQPGGVQGAIDTAKASAELLKMGDVARAGGDPDAAVKAWTRLLERFPADQNAEIAAYYLGGVYEKKAQPEKAKEYFARVQGSGLAEDALCHRVHIASGQGHKGEAVSLANEYVKKYPNGQCKADAEQVVGGEDEKAPASTAPKPAPTTDAAP